MVLKIKTTDRFLTRGGGLKTAVTIGLAGVALAATLSQAAAGTACPRIIHIPEREPASSDENDATPRYLAPQPEHRGAVSPLFDGPTPIRPTPRFKGPGANMPDGH
jgi:hypothetical protein